MWRLKARRSKLVDRGRGRYHRTAMAMLAADHRVLAGIGGIIGGRRERLPSRLGGTERNIVLSQVDEPDRQECQSGNDGDRPAKRRSENVAGNRLSRGFGHFGR
jgi:hypothetical protein